LTETAWADLIHCRYQVIRSTTILSCGTDGEAYPGKRRRL